MIRRLLLVLCGLVVPAPAAAQALEGCGADWQQASLEFERIGEHRYRRAGAVEIVCGDMRFYADEMEIHLDTHRLVARGNVVFTQGASRVAADRMEFDTKSRTGVFYHATGSVSLGERADRSMFGTQEPDAYFYGETLEKIGPRRYRITRGGFTTCVQPTPRWEVTSSSVVINLDDYALLRNSVLKVKGVPVLYLPLLYYPIQEDDRATGFLLPTYGASTYRGQQISNAFFWAIGRSHDATFFHDWYSRTGQGVGAEYRYALGPESSGVVRTHLLDERAVEIALPGGGISRQPARRSYQLDGSFAHALPWRLRARGQAQYFSNVTVQQLYHHDIYRASNRQRTLGGNVTGAWREYLLNATLQHSEIFYDLTSSNRYGALPRVALARAERPLANLPVYVQVGGEAARLVRVDRAGGTEVDRGTLRLDLNPVVRAPLARWPFLSVNTSVAWRATWWSRSQDAETRLPLEESLSRRYFDLQASVTGPVFTRIFDTPGFGYAERLKHVIEPSFSVQRVTAVEVFDRVLQLDGADAVIGGVTRLSYGLVNRLYARRRGGEASAPREVASLAVVQSYYSDARAAIYDRYYQSGFGGRRPSNFSPVRIVLRAAPAATLQGEFEAEYDTDFGAVRTMRANAAVRRGDWLDATGGWSQRRYIPGLPGFDDPRRRDHYLNGMLTLRAPRNRFGGTYSFNLDVGRSAFVQQRLVGYYNAQCCGFGIEYQTFNFGAGLVAGVPRDRRFNISVTLAGIGTFSNFFGALGGGEGRR
ncbi:MAG TPA: putative LPS assembly protein LptD [Vicinamibacterales bacterium]|nr:putative LPS assembly protein LptD [Vicinamibacterales bacterium]